MSRLRNPVVAAAILFCLVQTGCSEAPEAPQQEPSSSAAIPASQPPARYVGNQACLDCHQDAGSDWQGSHHDLALEPATADTVLASLPAELDGAAFAESASGLSISPEPGAPALPARFTFGVYPLQQYVISGTDGAWQTFPIAWDSRPAAEGGQRLFNLYDSVYPPGDPMHWQGRANRWNSQCADCHSTGVRKNYDPETFTYDTRFEVEDVGCEACHGPGSRHVGAPAEATLARLGSQSEQINACAPCHSRRGQIAEGFQPSADYLDHYSPRLLSPDLYHVDGQIDEEVYVWGSFLQSPMHRAGVTCTDCHNPHSGTMKRPGNATCTFCHQPSPAAEFADRAAGTYDTPDHHLHPAGSEGAQCVSCHMPSKTYMGVDARRDHSFRIPRPDLAIRLGVPEPCSACHSDQTQEWAAAVISEHFGSTRPAHFAETFAAADAGQPGADAQLAALVSDAEQPVLVRASALERLGRYNRGYTLDAIRLARSGEPLLRFAAPPAAASLTPERRWQLLAPLLEDDLRAVRQQAVTALIPTIAADEAYRERLTPHLQTWLREQELNLDYPETLTNVAGAYGALGQLDRAEASLDRALEIQADWIPGLMNLADVYRATGRDPQAGRLLQRATALAPDYPEVLYAYGLWLSRQGRLNDGLPYFEKAASLTTSGSHYGYAWAVALNDSGDSDRAVSVLTDLLERWPQDQQLLIAAITMLRDQGRFGEALPLLDRLILLRPNDQQLMQFREAIVRAAAAG